MTEAVVLAAGYGKGLEPITHTRHKVLVPIINKPLIEYHISNLSSAGIKKINVVVNYLRSQVEESLKKIAQKYGVDFSVIDQGKPLGTGHALLKAMERVSSEHILVIYGDVFIEREDLLKIINSGRAPLIASYRVPDARNFGVLEVSDGTLRKIIEKPETPPSNLINAGIYLLDHHIIRYLERLEPSPRGEYELTDAINEYTKDVPVKVAELGFWMDVGRPWRILDLNKRLLSRYSEQIVKGHMEAGAVIKGPVVIEEGAEVLSGTYIMGPAHICKGASVGPNAFIRPYSVILENAKIGFNVEVKGSVVMEGAHVAHQAYVGDSIVGEESNLGAGTILANLRFDNALVPYRVKGRKESSSRRKLGAIIGGHVKTGVNVSTYPGVKIGAYSWINPGLAVREDIPPCTHYVAEGVFKPVRGECRVDLSVWRP